MTTARRMSSSNRRHVSGGKKFLAELSFSGPYRRTRHRKGTVTANASASQDENFTHGIRFLSTVRQISEHIQCPSKAGMDGNFIFTGATCIGPVCLDENLCRSCLGTLKKFRDVFSFEMLYSYHFLTQIFPYF
jgi:hypothetical protein